MEVKHRLVSLDVFRGLTIAGMILVNNPGSWSVVYPPLLHAQWHGCTPTDWVFPFFLFIVGVAIPLALGNRRAKGATDRELIRKIAHRTVIIFLLGLLLAAFPHFGLKEEYRFLGWLHYTLVGVFLTGLLVKEYAKSRNGFQLARLTLIASLIAALSMLLLSFWAYDLSRLRIMGVLQRIALVYGICALLFLKAGWRTQAVLGLAILLGYWALMTLVPVPDGYAPNLDPETNLGAWLDRTLLTTDHLWRQSRTWDPEGLLSTLPAVATGITGMLTGTWLKSSYHNYQKTTGMMGIGACLLALGLIWDAVFPINKALWTSSYVLYTGGIALLLLGLCYWLIDILHYQRWAQPFVEYGINALFVYLASGIVVKFLIAVQWTTAGGETESLRGWLYDTLFVPFFSPINASLAFAIANVVFFWLLAHLLYRGRVFIKV